MSAAVSNPASVKKVHLRVLTNSELREARACLRRHYFKYRLRRRPLIAAEPLTFGTLWHSGQEALWSCDGTDEEKIDCALSAIRTAASTAAEKGERVNDFMVVTICELTIAYVARWSGGPYRAIAVEQTFEVPLTNPATGVPSRTFRLGGKFDGIVLHTIENTLHVIEHKSTTADIEFGSLYWAKVKALDTQVSLYLDGARAAGYDVQDCLYDVVRKPGIKPLKATPEGERKYTSEKSRACKACKKTPGPHLETVETEDGETRHISCENGRIVTDRGGRLYANMRDRDESPEEFAERLRADIRERPERYFARDTIVRLADEERDFAFDTWQAAKLLHEAEISGFSPKNSDACSSFGTCEYLAVCCGEASIDDPSLFRTAASAHEELEIA